MKKKATFLRKPTNEEWRGIGKMNINKNWIGKSFIIVDKLICAGTIPCTRLKFNSSTSFYIPDSCLDFQIEEYEIF